MLGYQNSKHHEQLYAALENPSIKRLLVIWPPAHAKTTCATINYPAWRVGLERNTRFILTSHTADFVKSFVRGIKSVMSSPEYKSIFGDLKPEAPDLWNRNELIVQRDSFEKDPTFTALSVNSSIIGRRADEIIVDDPIDETTANSETLRDEIYRWFTKELVTRLEPNGRLMVIMTRWHFADIASKLLEEDEYDVVRAPFGYKRLISPAIGPNNEVLWPEKWPLDRLLARKKEIGAIAFESQYQAHPIASLHAPLKVEWLHYWHETDEDLEAKIHKLPSREKLRIIQAWDLAISEQPEADWTVCVTLGVEKEGAIYLLDYYRAHIDFPAQVKQVEAQALAWKPERIAIETVAYQKALPQQLRHGMFPITEIKPVKDKGIRIQSLAPYFENGTIRVSKGHEEFLLEYLQFPKSEHDDILDALQMAVAVAVKQTQLSGAFTLVGAKRK